jgi:hypothetical protein
VEAALIEQHIGRGGHHLVFVQLTAVRVIETIPFLIVTVLCIGEIMTSSKAAKVVLTNTSKRNQ